MKLQKIVSSQSNLEKQREARGIKIPDIKLYYTAVVINTVVY